MKILVDGDACPVKKEICEIASIYNIKVVIIIATAHWSADKLEAEYVLVDSDYQAVDLELINRIENKDIVITNDYGLAALALAKGAVVLSNRGKQFREENINHLLSKRHFFAKMRRSGNKSAKTSKFDKMDCKRFKARLRALIDKKLEGE